MVVPSALMSSAPLIQRFAGWLSTGEGKWVVALKSLIRLGCLVQRLTVYTVATVNSHLPIALDYQPANLCSLSNIDTWLEGFNLLKHLWEPWKC